MQWSELQRIIAEEVSAALAQAADAHVRVPFGALRLLPRSPARRDRCRRVAPRPLRRGEVPSDVASLIDHTLLKAGRHPAGNREALPRGGASSASPPCALTRPGSDRGAAAAGQRRRRLLGGRVSARRDDQPTSKTTRRAGRFSTERREVDMVINVGALKSGDLAHRGKRHRGVSAPATTAAR